MNQNSPSSEIRELQVALIHPGDEVMYLERHGDTLKLPTVAIPAASRTAHAVQEAVFSAWSIKSFVLDCSRDDREILLATCLVLSDLPPRILHPVCLRTYLDSFCDTKRREHLARIMEDKHPSVFSNISWHRKAVSWIEGVTGESLSSMEEIVQLKCGPSAFLACFPMQNGRQYWMKATTGSHRHEAELTRFLSSLFDEDGSSRRPVPKVIATHPEWNAWLTAGISEAYDIAEFSVTETREMLLKAADSLARLQREAHRHQEELFRLGASDQLCEMMLRSLPHIRPFLIDAMARQSSSKAPQLNNSDIDLICDELEEALQSPEVQKMPASILHGDLNEGNLLLGESVQFIDWNEAYVGPCCISLQHLLLLNRHVDQEAQQAISASVVPQYIAAWSDIAPPHQMRKGLSAMDLLGAFSVIHGRGPWPSTRRSEPETYLAYVRMLTRHMHRAVLRRRKEGAVA